MSPQNRLLTSSSLTSVEVSTITKIKYQLIDSDKNEYQTNIKVACSLILTHLKEEMKRYEEEFTREVSEAD